MPREGIYEYLSKLYKNIYEHFILMIFFIVTKQSCGTMVFPKPLLYWAILPHWESDRAFEIGSLSLHCAIGIINKEFQKLCHNLAATN